MAALRHAAVAPLRTPGGNFDGLPSEEDMPQRAREKYPIAYSGNYAATCRRFWLSIENLSRKRPLSSNGAAGNQSRRQVRTPNCSLE
jgi:hypothetical protein